jgi:GNAT superfamily N-acetyltransferase
MTARPQLRPATVDDLDAMFEHLRAGFASYVDFAPAGWQPPPVPDDRDRVIRFLNDADTWALMAVTPERSVGHVSFIRGAQLPAPGSGASWLDQPAIPGLAHLWQLFVMPGWWGTGAAGRLHDAAIEEMTARGYASSRLYTPSGSGRARRFYERNGWEAAGEQMHTGMGLPLTEYRRTLS